MSGSKATNSCGVVAGRNASPDHLPRDLRTYRAGAHAQQNDSQPSCRTSAPRRVKRTNVIGRRIGCLTVRIGDETFRFMMVGAHKTSYSKTPLL